MQSKEKNMDLTSTENEAAKKNASAKSRLSTPTM